MMKAAFYQGNKKITVAECQADPPGPGQVQIMVHYAGVCGSDYHIYLGDWDWRMDLPKIIGHEMSGEVSATGEGVLGCRVGDRVVVYPIEHCGNCKPCRLGYYNLCQNIKVLGMDKAGAFQQYWTVPEYMVHRLPPSTDMKRAALIEPVAVALHAVRRGKVTDKDFVVVQGAGPIGMLVALLAKMEGAHVVVSEINRSRENLARELGLEAVNPLENDLVGYVHEQTGSDNADVVFDASASAESARIMTELVGTHGQIVIVGQFPEPVMVNLRRILWWECNLTGSRNYEVGDFDSAISIVASGRLAVDRLISGVRPLEQLQATFEEIERGASFLKVLLKMW